MSTAIADLGNCNDICFECRCKNCPWETALRPVKDWVAVPSGHLAGAYKIFRCPLYNGIRKFRAVEPYSMEAERETVYNDLAEYYGVLRTQLCELKNMIEIQNDNEFKYRKNAVKFYSWLRSMEKQSLAADEIIRHAETMSFPVVEMVYSRTSRPEYRYIQDKPFEEAYWDIREKIPAIYKEKGEAIERKSQIVRKRKSEQQKVEEFIAYIQDFRNSDKTIRNRYVLSYAERILPVNTAQQTAGTVSILSMPEAI